MVKIKVPATSANLGPGFDFLGLALDLFNIVEFTPAEDWLITAEGYGAKKLSGQKDLLVCQAVKKVFAVTGESLNGGVIHLTNNIPDVGGLGSSASAIVGGLAAANTYLGEPLTKDELLYLASEIEGHPDNVAPAIFGGLVGVVKENTCSGQDSYSYLKIPFPMELQVVLAIPEISVATTEARKLLPSHVPFSEAVFNLTHTGLFIGACYANRLDLLETAMQDKLHQDRRAVLIPGFHSVIEAASENGAIGVALSGAGPTIIAFSKPDPIQAVGEGMVSAFAAHGIKAHWLSIAINNDGYIVA